MEPYVTQDSISAKTKEWLEKIAPFNTHAMQLNREKSALLVVDMQYFFLDPASPTYTCGGQAIIPNIQKIVRAFRHAGRPVIYSRHVHHPDGLDAGIMGWWWEGMCLEGSPESEIHRDIAPAGNEKVINKHRYSAFYNTDLETILRTLKVEDLVMTGIMTRTLFGPVIMTGPAAVTSMVYLPAGSSFSPATNGNPISALVRWTL